MLKVQVSLIVSTTIAILVAVVLRALPVGGSHDVWMHS